MRLPSGHDLDLGGPARPLDALTDGLAAAGSLAAAAVDGHQLEALEVVKGAHDSPTTTIKMSASDFIDMIQGKLNAMKAYTGGQLKIEGDLMKSQLIEKLFKF